MHANMEGDNNAYAAILSVAMPWLLLGGAVEDLIS